MAETLYLIDGHAQIYRAFYAVEGLTTPEGLPTGAVFGFTRMLLDLDRKHRPDRLVAVFDAPGPTFRHTEYAGYKATRKPTPPELLQQIPLIQEVVAAYRIPVVQRAGFEADDVLGTLARRGEAAGLDVVIVTGDKDCGQLLTDHVRMYDPMKDVFTDAAAFEARKGLPPDRLPDLMGLWGDASDNIPGVPGIGEKIGAELIRQYGSLEKLLDYAHEVKGKRGEVLRAHRDQARLSKRLATIRTDAPVDLDPAAARRRAPDYGKLQELFDRLHFRSLARQLEIDRRAAAAAGDAGAHDAAPAETAPADEPRRYHLVNTPALFDAFLAELGKQPAFALDTETADDEDAPGRIDPLHAELVGVSFCWTPGEAYYLPFRGPAAAEPSGDLLGAADGAPAPVLGPDALDRLKPVLADPAVRKAGQNLKYDRLALARAGAPVEGQDFDTLLASHLARGGVGHHDLDALALRHLNWTKIPTRDLIGAGRRAGRMDAVALDRVRDYACEDVDVVRRLEPVLRRELADNGMERLFTDLELPLSFVLTDMQRVGIRIDRGLLAAQSAELGLLLERLTGEIHALAGRAFNIASTRQLGDVLFGEMGLPPQHRTETGVPSTGEATLALLAAQGHEIAARVLEYRAYAKLKGTYLDALPLLVHPRTGRVHTTFSQTATATGRLSSRDPNLQNIPVRTDRGRAVRAAFVPADGWKMLAADYSQVELRMLAHFSGDPALRTAFAEGRDIHRAVAAAVAGVPEYEVSKEMRSAAKAVNFGIVYGQTAYGLAESTGMTPAAAQRFIHDYFERYPRVRAWLDDATRQAHRDGGVRTLLGRRRALPDLKSAKKPTVARAEREAVNTIIQGSAADLVKTAMVNLHRRMARERLRARMLLQIHDELLFEAPPGEVDALAVMVREEMENALPLEVKPLVDLGVGDNWLEVK